MDILLVYYDPQTFMRQRTGGISRLFTDLVREFDGNPTLGVTAALPFRISNNEYAARDLPQRNLKSTPSWLPRGVAYAPWWLRGSRLSGNPEIVHHTYYNGRFLSRTTRAKQVTTVYDMIPELFAGTEQFTATHLQKRAYVGTCDLVICISESTRQDMVAIYGDIARRVQVIPLAVQPGFGPGLPRLPGLPQDYLLYVGARKGYKDFNLLPHALREARSVCDVPPLVVVGKAFTPEERRNLARQGCLDSTIQVSLDDEALKRAYSNCTALVQTSRYEGFGLTPLEGMASGAPVVVARASSMPEVGGDIARYFEAGDAGDLARSITEVLDDDGLRAQLRIRGPHWAEGFSVLNMAKRTAAAYAHAIEESG